MTMLSLSSFGFSSASPQAVVTIWLIDSNFPRLANGFAESDFLNTADGYILWGKCA
jgi:hypothetical protein